MITNKSFIERCLQFQEEPLAAVEVGEASSPLEPLKVSEEIVEQDDSIEIEPSDRTILLTTIINYTCKITHKRD